MKGASVIRKIRTARGEDLSAIVCVFCDDTHVCGTCRGAGIVPTVVRRTVVAATCWDCGGTKKCIHCAKARKVKTK